MVQVNIRFAQTVPILSHPLNKSGIAENSRVIKNCFKRTDNFKDHYGRKKVKNNSEEK